MATEDYKVQIIDQEKIPGGAKLELHLVDRDTEEKLQSTKIGLEDWQLKDDRFEERIQNIGARMIEDYESEDPDVTGKEVSL